MIKLPQQEDRGMRVFIVTTVMSLLVLIIVGGFFILYDKGFQIDDLLGLERSALRMDNITIWNSSTAREAKVADPVKRTLRDLMSRYDDKMNHLEIRVSGLEQDQTLSTDTGDIIYVLRMEFQNGSVIRTRSRRSGGDSFGTDVARDMRIGATQFDKLMREGVIGWDKPGGVINI